MTSRQLLVRHTTVYRYSVPVAFGDHHMMFRPRASYDLRLLRTRLKILPKPATLHWIHDVFDNSVAIATFDTMARELRFESNLTLEHLEIALPDYRLDPRARLYPFTYSEPDLANLRQAMRRRHPDPELDGWVRQFLDPTGPSDTMELLLRVIRSIEDKFSYERRTEKGVQSPRDTLRSGRGSCRDFALLVIEAVRSLGFAARFVSGYIFVPGIGATTGSGATHAWLQVYLPGAGWVDFDPTNAIVGNRNLIRVAVVWDPPEALPLWGSFLGSASSFREMEVTVNVTERNGEAGADRR